MDQLVIITDPTDLAPATERRQSETKETLICATTSLSAFPRLGIIEPPTPGVTTPSTPHGRELGGVECGNVISAASCALRVPLPSSPRRNIDEPTSLDRPKEAEGTPTKNDGNQQLASPVSRSSSRERTHRRTSSHEVKETLGAFSSKSDDGSRTVNQYLLKGLIGKGGYARVELATDRETGVSYAVKEFSKSRLRKIAATDALRRGGVNARGRGRLGPTTRLPPAHTLSFDEQGLDNLNLIRTEVAILKKLNHPAICSIHEVIDINSDEGNDSIMIVMELCPGGTIDKAFTIPMQEEVARGIFRQLTLGIAYLHANSIIHRDVKPDNVLFLKDKSTIRIVDFGVSTMFTKVQDDSVGRAVGTPAFMAPELCSTSQQNSQIDAFSCDIWSMGVTLYSLVVGKLPFSGDLPELFRAIQEDPPDIPTHLSPSLQTLLQQLLSKSPSDRSTIQSLWSDPWLTAHSTDPLLSYEENVSEPIADPTEQELHDAFKGLKTFRNAAGVLRAANKFRKSATRRSTSLASAEEEEGLVGSELMLKKTASPPSSPGMIARDVEAVGVPVLLLDDDDSASKPIAIIVAADGGKRKAGEEVVVLSESP